MRWLVAVAAVLLVVPPLLAAAVSAARSPVYAVQADILYQDTTATTDQSIDRELATQQVLLQGRPRIEQAAEVTGLNPRDLAENVSVGTVEDSSVFRLRVEDANPERALVVAQSLVDQYVEIVAQQAEAASTDARERDLLQRRIDEAAAQLAAVEARLTEIGVSVVGSSLLGAEERRLTEDARGLRQQISSLETQLTAIDLRALQEQGGEIQVLAPPAVLDEPVGPQPLRAGAAGLLVGLVLLVGLLVALRARPKWSGSPAA